MWVLPKMMSLQMWKHYSRTSFKEIFSRAAIHMCAKWTCLRKLCRLSTLEVDRRNKRTKRKYENAKEMQMETERTYGVMEFLEQWHSGKGAELPIQE